ncbi:MAG: hypothetical protein MI749_13310 [Desulfovibrionales bacterium]|nr:hypothetical protein [Desulfovibrionales bacterium]
MRIHILLVSICLSALFVTTAFAHRVTIFAWPDGNVIRTESTFSSGKKAQQATVTVTNEQTNTVIASGTTNSSGEWMFTPPKDIVAKKIPLRITLDAGQGHASTWMFTSEDYNGLSANPYPDLSHAPETSSATIVTTSTPSPQETTPHTPKAPPSQTPSTAHAIQPLQGEEIRAIVAAVVENEIRPLKAQLAKLNAQLVNPQPTIRDIFGGIGYILGLLGLAAYIRYRKSTK